MIDLEIPFVKIDFLFSVSMAVERTPCLFCDKPIEPTQTMITITLPEKEIADTHNLCFEQLAWCMMQYLFQQGGIPEVSTERLN